MFKWNQNQQQNKNAKQVMIAACNCALVLDAKVKPFSPSQPFADENSPGDLQQWTAAAGRQSLDLELI